MPNYRILLHRFGSGQKAFKRNDVVPEYALITAGPIDELIAKNKIQETDDPVTVDVPMATTEAVDTDAAKREKAAVEGFNTLRRDFDVLKKETERAVKEIEAKTKQIAAYEQILQKNVKEAAELRALILSKDEELEECKEHIKVLHAEGDKPKSSMIATPGAVYEVKDPPKKNGKKDEQQGTTETRIPGPTGEPKKESVTGTTETRIPGPGEKDKKKDT